MLGGRVIFKTDEPGRVGIAHQQTTQRTYP